MPNSRHAGKTTSGPDGPAQRRGVRLSLKLCFSFAITVCLFLLLEGLCSTAVVVRDMTRQKPLAERVHTEYDPQLGWVNKPDSRVPDMYGPGRDLRTNAQRFRNPHAFEKTMPPGKLRVICSGDSFTLGYGVGDEDTWAAQVESIDDRLQTVNMGQGGYGIDQAYLWYQRVRDDLDHALHLFAFISEDFRRVPNTTFCGYGKPVLELRGNELVVTNVPVPRSSYRLLRLVGSWNGLQKLDSVRVARRLIWGKQHVPSSEEARQHAEQVALAMFGQLQEQHREKGRILVLIHLPTREDYARRSSLWRDFMRTAAAEKAWLYVDLADELNDLPQQQVEGLFLGEESVGLLGASGHYNEKGNRFIAEVLHGRLMADPEVRKALDARF